MNTLKYDNVYIVLEGFSKVTDELTFMFLGSGISIVPTMRKQKENNYPLVVKRDGQTISIKDKDLIDIFQYLKIPNTIEFVQYEDGYIACLE